MVAKKKPRGSATQSQKKEGKTKATLGNSRIEQYYNKIVGVFVILTVILVLLIGYFSFSKTTITIYPAEIEEEITIETTLQELGGVVLLTEVEGSKEYSGFTSAVSKPAKASGTVTIVNNYSQNQPLVETTRLLSTEGVLFRTQETVTVPAGGSVEVEVAADEEGEKGNIPPSKFEIVALWEGLKDDIYATSDTAMTGGVVEVAAVTTEDIETAKEELQNELLAQAQELFVAELDNRENFPERTFLPEVPTVLEVLSEEVDAEPGDEVDTLTVTQELTVSMPVLNQDKLLEMIRAKIQETLPEGQELKEEISMDAVSVIVNSLSDDKTDGAITITTTHKRTINADSDLIDLRQLTNKSSQEVKAYLEAFEEIESVDISLSPFWMTRTPSLTDHITVLVESR